MSEKQGFKNAPTVTAFAVGMRVLDLDISESFGTVVRTDEYGAYFLCHADILYRVTEAIPKLRLDLSPERVWVGREYRDKGNHARRVRILAPPEFTDRGRVHFVNCNAVFCCWSVTDFLRVYEPLPLNEAEPKVEMSDFEKVFPGLGEACQRKAKSLVREYLSNMIAEVLRNQQGGEMK